MLNYLKKKFKKDKDVPAVEQFYSPLRIAMHSTIVINTVDLLLLSNKLNPFFTLPVGDMSVLAIGKMVMDGNNVYQIYVEDTNEEEYIIRIVEAKNHHSGKAEVAEINLFKQVFSEAPETEEGVQRILSQIGFHTIELEGQAYERLWGSQYTEKLDFRTFEEFVVTPQEENTYTNKYILYGRDIENMAGQDYVESLLVGIEEDDDQAQIVMQAGINLNINDIEVQ